MHVRRVLGHLPRRGTSVHGTVRSLVDPESRRVLEISNFHIRRARAARRPAVGDF